MILTSRNVDAHLYCIYDCNGTLLPYVTYFDSETCEIEMGLYINNTLIRHPVVNPETGNEMPEPMFLKFVLPGATVVKRSEDEIKKPEDVNLGFVPLSGGVSAALEDPVWPTPIKD